MNGMMVKLRGWELIELPGRAPAMSVQQIANMADVTTNLIRKALKRHQPQCEYPLSFTVEGNELQDLKNKQPKWPLVEPGARHLTLVTLPGIAMLGTALKRLMLTIEAILVAMEYSKSNSFARLDQDESGSQIATANSSPRLLEHDPEGGEPKPPKPPRPKTSCDLDVATLDWLLEFATSKDMTKAEATRQIIRDRRAQEESPKV